MPAPSWLVSLVSPQLLVVGGMVVVMLVTAMIAIFETLKALGVVRKGEVSLNEQMRVLYYVPALLFAFVVGYKVIQYVLGVEWPPAWLTEYADNLLAPQLVAYFIFLRAWNEMDSAHDSTVRSANVQINAMRFAQTLALCILVGWEVTNHTLLPFFGGGNWWNLVAYVVSFVYGMIVLYLWEVRAAQRLENLE